METTSVARDEEFAINQWLAVFRDASTEHMYRQSQSATERRKTILLAVLLIVAMFFFVFAAYTAFGLGPDFVQALAIRSIGLALSVTLLVAAFKQASYKVLDRIFILLAGAFVFTTLALMHHVDPTRITLVIRTLLFISFGYMLLPIPLLPLTMSLSALGLIVMFQVVFFFEFTTPERIVLVISAVFVNVIGYITARSMYCQRRETYASQISLERANRELQAISDSLSGQVELREGQLSEAARELQGQADQLRLIADAMPALIVYVDASQRLQFVNETAEQWLARPSRELLGRATSEVFGASLSHAARHQIDAVLAGKPQFFESAQTYPDGQTREVAANYIPHFDENGLVLGFYALVVDITERRALEERLRQSEKMEAIGHLTGGIAHEFNNLLQVVNGNISLLADDIPNDPASVHLFRAIKRNVARGAELTSRLLSFGRRQQLAPKALVIGDVLAEMQGMLGQTLGEMIEVKVAPAVDVWEVEADPGQLENALLNLTLNARDAMPNGGVITLSAENISFDEEASAEHEEARSGSYVMLSVTDDGSGMTKEAMSRAFEPFFTTKDVGEGTGLGLSMVYGFAQQSGGFAEIDSVLDQGTTARLYLPRLVGTKGEETAPQDGPAVTDLPRSGTILLVEDNADVRGSLAGELTGLGYKVIEAHDGAAALARLADEGQLDLLFTDVVMPGGLNGLELARQALRLRPQLKVLYTTGYSDEIIIEAGQLPDGATVLRKPFDKVELAATISHILN